MQAFTKDLFHKIVFTLIIKVPHFCLQCFRIAPSVALLLHIILCSVFKVQIRRFTPFGSDCYRPALCTL